MARLADKTSKQLTKADLQEIHRHMVEGRVLEENLIALYRRGDGFFWIGGPGEEAFNVPLGLMVHKGHGPAHDYMHFHYRNSATWLALGGEAKDCMRQMKNTATDPFSGGRNFVNHIAYKPWNIVPVASTIETQYSQCIGTAWVQRRHGGKGISIVTGGDAGSAEGDFATCLVWANRPKAELPLLIIITNNEYGISTARDTQWPMRDIISRAEPFGIPWESIDGNDLFESWDALRRAMKYIREKRKPYALQANVSRLNGHSSASGATRTDSERDCLVEFEAELKKRKVYTQGELDGIWESVRQAQAKDLEQVRSEPDPTADSIFDHIYAEA